MKVNTIKRFKDLDKNEVMEPGHIYETSQDRAEHLSVLGYVEIIKEIETASLPKKAKEIRHGKSRPVQDTGMEEDPEVSIN